MTEKFINELRKDAEDLVVKIIKDRNLVVVETTETYDKETQILIKSIITKEAIIEVKVYLARGYVSVTENKK